MTGKGSKKSDPKRGGRDQAQVPGGAGGQAGPPRARRTSTAGKDQPSRTARSRRKRIFRRKTG